MTAIVSKSGNDCEVFIIVCSYVLDCAFALPRPTRQRSFKTPRQEQAILSGLCRGHSEPETCRAEKSKLGVRRKRPEWRSPRPVLVPGFQEPGFSLNVFGSWLIHRWWISRVKEECSDSG